MAKAKKDHNRKVEEVRDLGVSNCALLDVKLDLIGEMFILKMDQVMKSAARCPYDDGD